MSLLSKLPPAACAAGLLVVASLTTGSAYPSPPSVRAQAGPPRCFAVNVRDRTIQVATQRLRAADCTPGTPMNGHHYLVNKQCKPLQDFGKVVDQSAVGRLLGPHERLIITVGIRGTAGSKICDELNPSPGTPPSPADYDGSYSFAFTVTDSTTVLVQKGQQLTGLSFTAHNGNLTGDIQGQVNASGNAVNTQANLVGFACPAQLTFTLNGSAVSVAGNADCKANGKEIKGTIAASRLIT